MSTKSHSSRTRMFSRRGFRAAAGLAVTNAVHAAFIALAALMFVFINAGVARSQSSIHGSTAASQAPGAPSGSYALTGFENVNLYNGNLNFHLPLLTVGGRGESGYTITLPTTWRHVLPRRNALTPLLAPQRDRYSRRVPGSQRCRR